MDHSLAPLTLPAFVPPSLAVSAHVNGAQRQHIGNTAPAQRQRATRRSMLLNKLHLQLTHSDAQSFSSEDARHHLDVRSEIMHVKSVGVHALQSTDKAHAKTVRMGLQALTDEHGQASCHRTQNQS